MNYDHSDVRNMGLVGNIIFKNVRRGLSKVDRKKCRIRRDKCLIHLDILKKSSPKGACVCGMDCPYYWCSRNHTLVCSVSKGFMLLIGDGSFDVLYSHITIADPNYVKKVVEWIVKILKL